MKRIITYLILILPGIILFNACTERIDIELEEEYVRLAVEGYIAPDEGANYIRLTKTGGYFSNVPAPPVSNAIVKVENGDTSFILREDMYQAGTYLFPQQFSGEQQQTYTLDIELQEELGGYASYKASAYMPVLDFHIDSISVELNTVFDFWMILIYAPKPPGRNFYLIKGMRNDTLLTSAIDEVNVLDDDLLDNEYMHGIPVMGIEKENLKPGDKFTMLVSLITEDYYNYITEVQIELQPHDPMFSGPPANVRSNVDNGAVGYFAAYASTSASTIVEEP